MSVDHISHPPTVAPRRIAFCYFVYFISGMPALIYQVIWQRTLTLYFGVDIYSVAIIVAVFMLGLGLGSLLGGQIADRTRVPARVYALVELFIAVVGAYTRPKQRTGTILAVVPEEDGKRHPGADDILCALEIADSSRAIERTTKLALFAFHGIRFFIIVNLVKQKIESYRDPAKRTGRYSRVETFGVSRRVSLPSGESDLPIFARKLLP